MTARDAMAEALYTSPVSSGWGWGEVETLDRCYAVADVLLKAGFGNAKDESPRARLLAILEDDANYIDSGRHSPEFSSELAVAALVAAGFGDVAEAKADAWDEGWKALEMWTGEDAAAVNPYRKNASTE